MASASSSIAFLVLLLFSPLVVIQCYDVLTYRYYDGKCGQTKVEELIFNVIEEKMRTNKGLVGDLVRLQFHDCFVKGCDASVLLDGRDTEKTASPNLDLDGFDDIDNIKTAVENSCPGLVSCADILTIAARDTIYLAGGTWYEVETGRKDSIVSKASDALILPGPRISMNGAINAFADKGLNLDDMVVLLGAHTVGTVHCNNFQDRLYNYRNTNKPDPAMDPSLREKLIQTCPNNESGTNHSTFLDQTRGSGEVFDTNFYQEIIKHKGVVDFDQRMENHYLTTGLVRGLAFDPLFGFRFGLAMVKTGSLGVLTGDDGEIRKVCSVVNTEL